MSATPWPAWMPEPPDLAACYGAECPECRIALLAWYAAAKQRDPDFGHVTPPRKPLPPGTDFEAAKRTTFPLPEDESHIVLPPTQTAPLPFPEDDNA